MEKNVSFDVLDDIVKDYNNTIHNSTKMKHVRICKYKNVFSKGHTPNWSQEIFIINKIQKTVPRIFLINDLKGEKIKGSFYEKELQKTMRNNLKHKKQLKRKEINYLLNGKVCDNSFNSWIKKKHII